VKQALQALFLVFRIGSERYALQATEVAEVLPRQPLKPIAHAPHWVAGVFAYRGAVVPVIDLCALTFGTPAQARTSTRLVLVITARMTAQR
jgi:chemotaxis-related protein WspB